MCGCGSRKFLANDLTLALVDLQLCVLDTLVKKMGRAVHQSLPGSELDSLPGFRTMVLRFLEIFAGAFS